MIDLDRLPLGGFRRVKAEIRTLIAQLPGAAIKDAADVAGSAAEVLAGLDAIKVQRAAVDRFIASAQRRRRAFLLAGDDRALDRLERRLDAAYRESERLELAEEVLLQRLEAARRPTAKRLRPTAAAANRPTKGTAL